MGYEITTTEGVNITVFACFLAHILIIYMSFVLNRFLYLDKAIFRFYKSE